MPEGDVRQRVALDVEPVDVGAERRVAVGHRDRADDLLPGLDQLSGHDHVLDGGARGRRVGDGQEAQQFVDHAVHVLLGVRQQDGELVRVFQEGQHAEADHAGDVVEPGEHHQAADAEQFLVVEVVAVVADELADEPLVRVLALPFDQRAQVAGGVRLGGGPVLAAAVLLQLPLVLDEELAPVVAGHAEQFAQDGAGDRARVEVHEVGGLPVALHGVQAAFRDLFGHRLEPLDAAHRELRCEHLAEPGVLGLVVVHQVAGHLLRAVLAAAADGLGAEPALVAEADVVAHHLPDRFVAQGHPDGLGRGAGRRGHLLLDEGALGALLTDVVGRAETGPAGMVELVLGLLRHCASYHSTGKDSRAY